ncbi:MAG: hypothetical protein N2115_03025 [bacterium]|nr:hypothetical protein [bacterium]
MKGKIVLGLLGIFISYFAYAHPPSDIKINFDPQAKILKATIIHNTNNIEKHYIGEVEIYLNGKEIISQKISKQENAKEQTAMYLISDVKKGDKITVEAYCSISGVLKKTITVDDKLHN